MLAWGRRGRVRDQANIDHPVTTHESNLHADAIDWNEESQEERWRWREVKEFLFKQVRFVPFVGLPSLPRRRASRWWRSAVANGNMDLAPSVSGWEVKPQEARTSLGKNVWRGKRRGLRKYSLSMAFRKQAVGQTMQKKIISNHAGLMGELFCIYSDEF